MSNAKRKELAGTGRGAVGKAAVVGAKDRDTSMVAAQHAKHTDTTHLTGFVAKHTRPGETVYTDESSAYHALAAWYEHESVNHSSKNSCARWRTRAGWIPSGRR